MKEKVEPLTLATDLGLFEILWVKTVNKDRR